MRNYAESFGLQWNEFRREQLDSVNGTRLSEQRFFRETGWQPDWLKGKRILDAGCGSGRFLEIAAHYAANVVAVDLSSAVSAAKANHPHSAVVQASLDELPFTPGSFDACYCIGVLQHLPDPASVISSLARVLAPGGRLAITAYERRRWTLWNGKYVLRPLTSVLPPRWLLTVLKLLMPILFVATELLFRLPVIGKLF